MTVERPGGGSDVTRPAAYGRSMPGQGLITLPNEGDPYDSRWGGPIPWDQRLAEWTSLGQPLGQRPFEGLGKVDISQSIPTAPVVSPVRGGAGVPQPRLAPPPQPGLAEAFSRGLTGMVTQFIPNGDIQSGADNVAGFLGGLIDFPFKAIPTMDFLPGGGGNMEEIYEKVSRMTPEDALRVQYDSFMAQDPNNAARYMSDYLNQRGSEVAEAMGITGMAAPMFTPSQNFSEQLRRLVFGGLTAAGDTVVRTFAGSLRDVDGSILNRDDEELPEELVELKGRHLDGQLTRDQFLDELSLSRYRWTNDDTPLGMGLSFAMDVLSDPLTWASFGIGGVLKTTTTGSVRLGVAKVSQAVEAAGRTDEALRHIASRTGQTVDQVKGVGNDTNKLLHDWARDNAPDLHQQGMRGLSGKQRSLYQLEPIVSPVAKLVNTMDNPFSWLSPVPNAFSRVLGSNIVKQHTQGWFSAFGYRTSKGVQDFFSDFDIFHRYSAIAAENMHVVLQQRAQNKQVLAGDPDFRGSDPMSGIQARREVADGSRVEAEELTLRTMESQMPGGRTGPDVVEEGLQMMRDRLLEPLVQMSGRSLEEAQAFLAGANRETLAMVHNLNYARTIDDVLTHRANAVKAIDEQMARTADPVKLEELGKQRATAEDITLISERLLSRDRAELLMRALDGDRAAMKELGVGSEKEAAQWARDQYDQLDAQYAGANYTDDVLLRKMRGHVRQLLEKKGDDPSKLVERLTDETLAEVAPDLAKYLGKQNEGIYSAGLMPKDRWGRTYDEAGEIAGVNSFVDVVNDGIEGSMTRRMGRRDLIRHGLFDGISGTRIHYEAKQRFIELGVKEYGLNKSDARRLFDAIRAESMKREVGARGFKAEEILQLANDLSIVNSKDAKKVGERGYLELTARAWEGDIRTVGATSKASGLMKSRGVQRTNNLVGRISESLYPYWRFGLSPMFLAMELTEGPFFAILRGIKPGIRWTEDDIRMNSILSYMREKMGSTRYMDQLEKVQLSTIESRAAKEIVAPRSRIVRYWNKVAPERLKGSVYAGRMTSGIYEYKEMLYMRQFGHDAALEMKRNAEQFYPEMWARWERELGTSNPEKVYMAIMEDRGMFDQDVRHNLHMFDAAKPTRLGRKERIRAGDVSKFILGSDGTAAKLREAVTGEDPAISRDAFLERYRRVGLNEQYAERAYTMARGFNAVEWDSAIIDAFPTDAVGAEAYTNVHKMMATMVRKDYAEFMNETYGQLPTLVDKVQEIPGRSMYQTLKTVMDRSGMKYPSKASTKRMVKRLDELRPEARALEPTTRNGKPYQGPVRQVYNANRTIADDTKRARFEEGPHGSPSAPFRAWGDEAEAIAFLNDINGSFNHVADDALQAASWYEEMPQVWYGAVGRLPDADIAKFNDLLDKALPSELQVGRLKDAREELAVRMNIAFTVGQQNTKVVDGFRFVWQMLDETLHGEAQRGANYGLGIITTRMEQLIANVDRVGSEEIANKLFDFMDSMAGNTKRTFTAALEDANQLQPAAMDIWMKRYFGWGDTEFFDLAVKEQMRKSGSERIDAEDVVLREKNWTREDLKKPVAPSKAQYEWMLREVNEYTKQFNEYGYLGKTDWKAWEVQALLWVKAQKDVGYVEAPPTSLLVQTGKQVEVRPMDYANTLGDRYPTRQQLISTYGEEAADSVMASIAHDVTHGLISVLKEETGVGIMRVIDTAVRNADGTVVPTSNLVFFGAPGQIDEAMGLLGALQQQDSMVAMARPHPTTLLADKANIKGGTHWSLDFVFPENLDQQVMRPNLRHLDEYIEDVVYATRSEFVDEMGEAMTGLSDVDSLTMRNIYDGSATTRAEFDDFSTLPQNIIDELNDGTWVHRYDPKADPIPVAIERNLARIRRSSDHTEVMKSAGRADADAVVGRHTQTARDLYDDAYARRAPDAFEHGTTLKSGGDPGAPSVYYAQKRGGLAAEPGRGSVRAAFNAGTRAGDGAAYFIRGATDASTAIHEAFHAFARNLDDSAQRDFIDAYNTATGRKVRTFSTDVEEWVSYEFEKWAAGEFPANARHVNTFAAYRKWYQTNQKELGLAEATSPAGPLFAQMVEKQPDVNSIQPATWNADEQRFWEATRLSNMRAENQAHSTAYYRRSRSFIERSLNHPYLGLYPASYMYGKVLPELTRFLVKKPFGYSAPLGGLLLATHAWRNLQLQLQVDEELREFVDTHPDTIRLLTLMVPGNPWELPANLPVVARRAMETAAENTARAQRGLEPKEYNTAGAVEDMVSYGIGVANLGGRLADMVGEFLPDEEET